MPTQLHPISFTPILKTVLWGGDKIVAFKQLDAQIHDVGESWEISGLPGRESIVAEGPDRGLSLPELIGKYRGALVGDAVYERYGTSFPLLVKFIDAHRDLSVQVHPNDELARRRHNSNGKTEMWYIIEAEEGARIGCGLNRDLTPEEWEKLVANKTVMDVVAQPQSHAGDVFYLPAGRVHFIGAGNLLAEIQQTADITYRIYDFDRRDAAGNLRELHTELALNAIDYHHEKEYVRHFDEQIKDETTLVACEHFDVRRLIVDGDATLQLPHSRSFVVVMCVAGETDLTDDTGYRTHLACGHTLLIPAALHTLTLAGHATLLTAQMP